MRYRSNASEPAGILIDLSVLRTASDEKSVGVMNFANAIKAVRKESTSSVIVVRQSDIALLAALMTCDPAALAEELRANSVLSGVI